MDDEDNEQIKHFEENLNNTTKLLKQQVFVVKTSLETVNNMLTYRVYSRKIEKLPDAHLKLLRGSYV
jgi:uncharacterized protein YlzI (FlbEa/FlbD family)